MDKYELVLDIIEHPDRYTSEQLAEILSEPETREIYNLLCKVNTAVNAGKEIDVDSEWETFSQEHARRPRRCLVWFGSRAASIAVTICMSIVAVAAGIAVTVAVIEHKPEPIANNDLTDTTVSIVVSTDTMTAQTDTVKVDLTPVMFEDEPLEAIMGKIAVYYGVEIRFNNKEAATLHLYYKLDPTLPLNEVVEQLNTFEQINITKNGNILNID